MWSIIIGPFHPSTINPSFLSHARQSLYKHDPLLFLLPCFARHQQRLSLHRAFHNAAHALLFPSLSIQVNENMYDTRYANSIITCFKEIVKYSYLIIYSLLVLFIYYQFVIISCFEMFKIDEKKNDFSFRIMRGYFGSSELAVIFDTNRIYFTLNSEFSNFPFLFSVYDKL